MEEIFSLIRKMSGTEKRLFAMSFDKNKAAVLADSPTKSAKKYLQLFQACQKLAEKHDSLPVDEDLLLRKKLGCNDHQFQSLKKYLADLLLDFLRHHHRLNLPELRLNNLLLDARILEEKGEIEWSLRKLKKALAEALQYELFQLAIEASARLLRLKMRLQPSNFEVVEEHFVQMEDCIEKQISELNYRRESCRIMIKQKREFKQARTAEQIAEVEALERSLLERSANEPPLTFQAQSSYFTSQLFVSEMKGDRKKTFEAAKAVVRVWDAYPKMVDIDTVTFIIHQGNLLAHAIRGQQFDEAAALMTKLEAIKCKNQEEELAKIANLDTRTFAFLINCDRVEDAIRFGGELERKTKKYARLLPAYQVNTFEFNFAMLHFLVEDFKKAHGRLTELLKNRRNFLPRLTVVTYEMLVLVLCYEMKEFEYIQTSHHAAMRRMRTVNFENIFERKVIDVLFKLTNTMDEKSRREILHEFRQYLEAVSSTENFAKPTGFAEIEIWSVARSEGVSIRKTFQRSLGLLAGKH